MNPSLFQLLPQLPQPAARVVPAERIASNAQKSAAKTAEFAQVMRERRAERGSEGSEKSKAADAADSEIKSDAERTEKDDRAQESTSEAQGAAEQGAAGEAVIVQQPVVEATPIVLTPEQATQAEAPIAQPIADASQGPEQTVVATDVSAEAPTTPVRVNVAEQATTKPGAQSVQAPVVERAESEPTAQTRATGLEVVTQGRAKGTRQEPGARGPVVSQAREAKAVETDDAAVRVEAADLADAAHVEAVAADARPKARGAEQGRSDTANVVPEHADANAAAGKTSAEKRTGFAAMLAGQEPEAREVIAAKTREGAATGSGAGAAGDASASVAARANVTNAPLQSLLATSQSGGARETRAGSKGASTPVAESKSGGAPQPAGLGVSLGANGSSRANAVSAQNAAAQRSAGEGVFSQAMQEAMAAQAARGVSAAMESKTGAVTLRLHPEALGQLKVKVSMEGASVAARFEVSSARAKAVLDKSMERLRGSLEKKGLSVERVQVDVAARLPEREIGLEALLGLGASPEGATGVGQDGALALEGEAGSRAAEDLRALLNGGDGAMKYLLDASGRVRMEALA